MYERWVICQQKKINQSVVPTKTSRIPMVYINVKILELKAC